jgi:MFS family permease
VHSFVKQLANNRSLSILLGTNAIILFAAALLVPIYALFVEKVGGDLLDASLAGAAFAMTTGVTVLLIGRLSDRVKENELLMILGYVVMGMGFVSCVWVDSMVKLFLAQIVIGFGNAIYSPAFDALYSKHLDPSNSGTEWGLWEAMNSFMAAGGAVTGGVIVNYFGFHALFVIMGILCAASAIYIFFLPRRTL